MSHFVPQGCTDFLLYLNSCGAVAQNWLTVDADAIRKFGNATFPLRQRDSCVHSKKNVVWFQVLRFIRCGPFLDNNVQIFQGLFDGEWQLPVRSLS